ncbi:suppressor of fused domain protein [Pengzhenrongella sicca]|uniref:Suppressor of fused domain protein n=1 Tax=Pengzhenrongella sicca TaxID=2819238 RepID=A0A8A4ZJZ5_9MICO|nr:suppressor of fused domain protein [Pengzhenrongella sicca]QTE30857.1 suppressor of fused domain protein [Pengzhenrongella sicca]
MTEPSVHPLPRGLVQALQLIYGDAEPDFRWETLQRWDEGGPDPLDEVLVFARHEPVPHWHYVGVGLTATSGPNPPLATRHGTSEEDDVDDGRGWSFELTARLSRADHEDEPPTFMANVLQNLARYVAETGNAFGPGHTMDLHGPIQSTSTTPVGHVLCVEDPELGFAQRSETGALDEGVDFLQIVGLTADEAAAKKSWTAEGFSDLFVQYYPLLTTHLSRTSIFAAPDAVAALETGRTRDGSSTAGLALDVLTVRDTTAVLDRLRRRRRAVTITIGAHMVNTFCLLLPLRIGAGCSFYLEGPETRATFVPESDVKVHEHEPADWVIGLSPDQARALSDKLLPQAGTYRVGELPDLLFEVRATVVRDVAGGVIETIG